MIFFFHIFLFPNSIRFHSYKIYTTKTNKMHENVQVVIGTKVGRTKHMRIMPGGALETEHSGPTSVFVGKKLDEHRGSFLLEYPMDKGHIVDGGWDAMESLWEVR